MIPFILILCFIGAFTQSNSLNDLITLIFFGSLGYLMERFHWPRPPFILGFILGKLAECYLYSAISRYGASWLLRPGVIILFCIAVMVALYPLIKSRRMERRGMLDEI